MRGILARIGRVLVLGELVKHAYEISISGIHSLNMNSEMAGLAIGFDVCLFFRRKEAG